MTSDNVTTKCTLAETQSTDRDIRDRLVDLDNSDKNVDTWTANYIDNIVFRYKGPLSEKQRAKAIEILEKFGF